MDLLRDNELIYGRLLRIEEPHLIERYNKALTAFGLKRHQAQILRHRPHRLLAAGRRGARRLPVSRPQRGQPPFHHPDPGAGRPAGGAHGVLQHLAAGLRVLLQEQPRHRRADHQGRDLRRDRGFGVQGRGHRGPALHQPGRVPGAVGGGCARQGGRTRQAGRPAEAGARRLARRRHASAHGGTRQGLRRHPRERAGAGPGHLPPQRFLDQPFRRALRVRRSRHDDGDQRSVGARLPPLAALAGQLSVDPRRRPGVQVPRRHRPHRASARLVDRDLRLSRAPRRNGHPRR